MIADCAFGLRHDLVSLEPRTQDIVMEEAPSLTMIQFLQWSADRPRRREDVMEAWRSSCPRFPVWEDACAERPPRQCGSEKGQHRVELTESGQEALERARTAL